MSFEGYSRMLCTNGHLDTCDVHDPDQPERCETCGKPFVWKEVVDQTNGDEFAFKTKLEINRPAEYTTCMECGHRAQDKEETYKIPVK